MNKDFKNEFDLKKRKEESARILYKYPERIPVIVQRHKNTIPDIDKRKFLIPNDLTIGQFIFVIRKRIKMGPEKGLFVFVNRTILPGGSTIQEVYNQYKDEDGFLYMSYNLENTFGSSFGSSFGNSFGN